jgi:hypothetical protein
MRRHKNTKRGRWRIVQVTNKWTFQLECVLYVPLINCLLSEVEDFLYFGFFFGSILYLFTLQLIKPLRTWQRPSGTNVKRLRIFGPATTSKAANWETENERTNQQTN